MAALADERAAKIGAMQAAFDAEVEKEEAFKVRVWCHNKFPLSAALFCFPAS